MIQHDIDFLNVKASLDHNKDDIKIVFKEDKNNNFSLN